MRIELGAPIIGARIGEKIAWSFVHLAAPERTYRGGFGHDRTTGFHDRRWPPLSWPSLCGLDGYLYVYDGIIRWAEIRFCPVCLERCNRELGGVAVSWDPPRDLRLVA